MILVCEIVANLSYLLFHCIKLQLFVLTVKSRWINWSTSTLSCSRPFLPAVADPEGVQGVRTTIQQNKVTHINYVVRMLILKMLYLTLSIHPHSFLSMGCIFAYLTRFLLRPWRPSLMAILYPWTPSHVYTTSVLHSCLKLVPSHLLPNWFLLQF